MGMGKEQFYVIYLLFPLLLGSDLNRGDLGYI